MRRLLINLFFLLVPVSFFAQEISENLESYQITIVGNQYIISGFKPESKGTQFEAYLTDKNLLLITKYSKTLPSGAASYYTAKSGALYVFTFYGNGAKEKYRIALDETFTEKYAAEPEPKPKKAEDDNTLEASDWVYDGSYCNDYIIGDLLIDAQMESISCFSLTDPTKEIYKAKWEKDFTDAKYVKMELIGINDRTAYFFAVQSVPHNIQKLVAIDIDNGTMLFNTELNEADSLDAISVSNLFVKEGTIYAAGTYVLSEKNQNFVPTYIDDFKNEKLGYENDAPFILAEADGYFVMSLDAKAGTILKMKTFGFPDIDKTVDYRDYRMAICHGITILADGNMLAFFELVSSPHKKGGGAGTSMGFGSGFNSEQIDPKLVLWETDGFTSVIFKKDMSEFNSTTMKWENESADYDLSDYDIFSLGPMQEIPHDFCTLGDDGAYPQNFVCDGTTWIYHVRGTDDKTPDYLVETTETDAKAIKLLPPGLLLLRDNKTGIQVKENGTAIKVKIFSLTN